MADQVPTIEGAIGAGSFDHRYHPNHYPALLVPFTINPSTLQIGEDGYFYRYVKADETIAAGVTDASVSSGGELSDGGGAYVVSDDDGFSTNERGWVRNAVLLADMIDT